MAVTLEKFLNQYFYFVMSLLVAAVVVAGFGPTIDTRLLHPRSARPVILYVHAAIFTSWVIFFILQTALVSQRNARLHRALGWWGAVLGAAIPVAGVATAIAMGRLAGHHGDDDAAFLALSFYDMLAFATAFGLAIHWRRKPEFHRRLMLVATCGLTGAAFARIMPATAPIEWVYVGADSFILLGMVRDLLVMRRIHPVYRFALPAIVLGQTMALYLFLSQPRVWLTITHRLIG